MSMIARFGHFLRNPKALASRVRPIRTLLLTSAAHDKEAMHLVYSWSSGNLQRKSLPEVFPGIESCDSVSVRKPESRIVGWAVDLQELVHILSIIRFTGARNILEVGTYDGFTALNLAANLADGGQISTVDLPQDRSNFSRHEITNMGDAHIVGSQYHGEKEEARIRQLWADSRKTDWRTFGGPFDMIFVDACHEYPYVKSDSINAVTHVRPGGTVLWHDYGFIPDVSRAVDEMAREYPITALTGTRLACYRRPAQSV